MSDCAWHANVVTALCNHPEAFASDLVDDQSRYLLINDDDDDDDDDDDVVCRKL